MTKILITVTTYPLPSLAYDELVCTAGVLEDGSWIRIYPVPFRFLDFRKYQWVELELIDHGSASDFRPESKRPKNPDLSDIRILSTLGTEQVWLERKNACLKQFYTNMNKLIEDSQKPSNVSLATFKPAKLEKLIIEEDDREWPHKWLEQLKQMDIFTADEKGEGIRVPIDKIPYKFKYQFEDDKGRESTMTIQDWEIGALYRNCLRDAEGDETVALAKVRQKYEDEFFKKDIYLFLGTTLEHHRKRHSNPFTIVGVFYPPKENQESLF